MLGNQETPIPASRAFPSDIKTCLEEEEEVEGIHPDFTEEVGPVFSVCGVVAGTPQVVTPSTLCPHTTPTCPFLGTATPPWSIRILLFQLLQRQPYIVRYFSAKAA